MADNIVRKANISVFDPADNSVYNTDEEEIAMRPELVPMGEDTARRIFNVRKGNERMKSEGRLLPQAKGYEDAMYRFFKMPANQRAERSQELDDLIQGWNQYVAIDPPRADWGDAKNIETTQATRTTPEWESYYDYQSAVDREPNLSPEEFEKREGQRRLVDELANKERNRRFSRGEYAPFPIRKGYSPSMNKTYWYENGKVVKIEEGDTRD